MKLKNSKFHSDSIIKPKLLLPAGDRECMDAAVANGADSVYFGIDRFNARMRAHNFTFSELPELMRFLHEWGVSGYVTFNTLIFENELSEAEFLLRKIIQSGVDAAIVQDIGICRLIRDLSPDFPIHGSTQMSLTSSGGIKFAENLGVELVALGRECSISEIYRIQQERKLGRDSKECEIFPLEVFIHGALCISYSGQCVASKTLGGRSANRGECAQPCRLPYQLIVDGKIVSNIPCYLLSPKDLIGLEKIPDLILAGVTCFKVEGRLKSPSYVANITRIYREAIDLVWEEVNQKDFSLSLCRKKLKQFANLNRHKIEVIFSRGLGNGWLEGVQHQSLCPGKYSANKGALIGKVISTSKDKVLVQSDYSIIPGEGLAFADQKTERTIQAGNVYHVSKQGKKFLLEFSRKLFQCDKLKEGNLVYKTSSPELEKSLRQSYSTFKQFTRKPLFCRVKGDFGTSLSLIFSDEQGRTVVGKSKSILLKANSKGLTPDVLRQQLGRLGDTPFQLENLDSELPEDCILPFSELNSLRRTLCEELISQRRTSVKWQMYSQKNSSIRNSISIGEDKKSEEWSLSVLVRSTEQFVAALRADVDLIYCTPEILKKCELSLSKYINSKPIPKIFFFLPRVFMPGEESTLEAGKRVKSDGILIRNPDQLQYFQGVNCCGDFSLNITNSLSADYYKNNWNLKWLTFSYDLNISQIAELCSQIPPLWFEFVLHQRIPLFYTAYCLYCRHLSHAQHFPHCGMPCEHHHLALRDRVSEEHIILTDQGCRNTIFNSRIQTACKSVEQLIDLGIRKFRLEFTTESASETKEVIYLYRQLLEKKISGEQLWSLLDEKKFALTRGNF